MVFSSSEISNALIKFSQGDIDVFLDRACYFALLEVKNHQFQLKLGTVYRP